MELPLSEAMYQKAPWGYQTVLVGKLAMRFRGRTISGGLTKEPSRSGTKAKQRSKEQGRAIGGCRVPCASVADS
jgi:hypothetical protein